MHVNNTMVVQTFKSMMHFIFSCDNRCLIYFIQCNSNNSVYLRITDVMYPPFVIYFFFYSFLKHINCIKSSHDTINKLHQSLFKNKFKHFFIVPFKIKEINERKKIQLKSEQKENQKFKSNQNAQSTRNKTRKN